MEDLKLGDSGLTYSDIDTTALVLKVKPVLHTEVTIRLKKVI